MQKSYSNEQTVAPAGDRLCCFFNSRTVMSRLLADPPLKHPWLILGAPYPLPTPAIQCQMQMPMQLQIQRRFRFHGKGSAQLYNART